MEKTKFVLSEAMQAVQRRSNAQASFPYKNFVCRCGNCAYSNGGKCALKVCCCMEERIRAHSCSFAELIRYCFTGVEDAVLQTRIRRAGERGAELKTCFLDAAHRKRFYEGLKCTRKADNALMAQVFLLSANEALWAEARKLVEEDCVVYSALELCIHSCDGVAQVLYWAAKDLEYGTEHADLAQIGATDFETFRMMCYAVAIGGYGMDAIRISEKRRVKKYSRREGKRNE